MNHFEEGDSHTFVINRGFEKCLVMYPEKVWEEITVDKYTQFKLIRGPKPGQPAPRQASE